MSEVASAWWTIIVAAARRVVRVASRRSPWFPRKNVRALDYNKATFLQFTVFVEMVCGSCRGHVKDLKIAA
jgi:hypothetical protein